MIKVTDTISLHENELQIEYIQASGPGGQNVNKTASQAQLRFDTNSATLPEDVRARLKSTARNRINSEGILIILAKRFRTQERNRADAVDRLVELIRRAATIPKTRRKTQPTKAARRKRLEDKRLRSQVKQMRRRIDEG